MKKLISLLLAIALICTINPVFALNSYEYLETFASATNSFTLGSWTYNAESQNISIGVTNQIAKFTDPENVLANAANYEISAEFETSQYAQNAIVFKADDNYSNYIMFRRSGDGYTEFQRMGSGQGRLAKSTVTSNLKSNETNTIKVVVTGNTYTGYMNGVEMLTYTDTNATANYNAGVRSNIANDGVPVTVDNFYVVNLDASPYLRDIQIDNISLEAFDFGVLNYSDIECGDTIPTVSAIAYNSEATVDITQGSVDNGGTATIVVTCDTGSKTYTISFVQDEPVPPPPEEDDNPDDDLPEDEANVTIVDNSYLENANNPSGFVRISETGVNNAFSRVATMGGTMAVFSGTSGYISFYPKVPKDGRYKVYASWAGNEYNRTDNFNYSCEFAVITPNSTITSTITQNVSNSNIWATDDMGNNIQALGSTVWNELGEVNLYSDSTESYVKVSGLQSNSRVDCIKFEYIGEAELEVLGFSIKANGEEITTAAINDTLTAEYKLNIPDSDVEASYAWELSDTADGIFLPIRDTNTTEFTILNEEYAGKYLRFTISIPSDDDTSVFSSQPVKIADSATATDTISEVVITGLLTEGCEITAIATIAGEIDADTQITYSVFTADEAGGTYEQIGTDTKLTAGTAFTCKLPETAEKYIRIRASLADSFKDSEPFIIRDKDNVSAVSDVSIHYSGKLNSYSTLTGDYTFTNKYNDADKSTYRWLKGSSASNMSYISGKDSAILSLDGSYENCYIAFEVTAKSVMDLQDGNTMVSSAVYIPKNSSSGSGSKSSGKSSTFGSSYSAPAATVTPELGFDDISGHWAQQSIDKMVKAGLLKGVTETQFEPDRNITRAEFITIIARALKLNDTQYQSIFSDVNATDWFANEITAAYSAGIVSGNNGLFNPNNAITREEAAKILVGAYKFKNNNVTTQEISFKDKDKISTWALEYVCNAYSLGLVQGDNNNMFEPQNYTTRAQATTMIERLLEKM